MGLDEGADALVRALVVGDDLVDLDAQVVAHHLQREVDLLVDQRRRLHGLLLGGRVDGRPLLLEQVEVALQLLALGAAGRGADDQPAAALRRQRLHQVAEAVALAVGQALRDAVALAVRRVDQEPAGQRHVHRDARALGAHRVLHDLHEQALAVLDQLLDLLLAALPVVELGQHDLVDVEEAVLGQAGVDERGLHAREDVVHPAEVHVAEQRAARGALEVGLDDDVVLDDRHPRFIRVGADQDLLHAVSPGAPTGVLPRSARNLEPCDPGHGEVGAGELCERARHLLRPGGTFLRDRDFDVEAALCHLDDGRERLHVDDLRSLRRGALHGRRLHLRVARSRALHHVAGRVERRRGTAPSTGRGVPSETAAERSSRPRGSVAARRSRTSSRSCSPTSSTVISSSSEATPTARATASEMTGFGRMPFDSATSKPARRNAASSPSTHSRCDKNRARPVTAKRSSIFKQPMRRGVGSGHQPVSDGAHAGAAIGAPVPAAVARRALGAGLPTTRRAGTPS